MQVLVLLESYYSSYRSNGMGHFREDEQQRMKVGKWEGTNHHFSCRQRTAYCETFLIKGSRNPPWKLKFFLKTYTNRKASRFCISLLVVPEQMTTD